MTAPLLEFRDSLVELLDGDVNLPELTTVDVEGTPRSLFDVTPPDGLAPGTVVWFGEVVRQPNPDGLRGAVGPEWDETFTVTIYVDAEVEPDGAAGEKSAAQALTVDVSERIVRSIRSATRDRRQWTSLGAGLSTKVARMQTSPPVTFQDGAAGCQTQIAVEHNTRSR